MPRLFQVDSFTDQPFKGNPAGVCLLETPMSEQWMRNIAMEMALAESAFLLKEASGYRLRWFTPTVEIPLCGHATLATAHVLWEQGIENPEATLAFNSLSGVLRATRSGAKIELDFPAADVIAVEAPSALLAALGITRAKFFGIKSDFPMGFIEIDTEADVRALRPNFTALKNIAMPAVIVTARAASGEPYDFVSRFFGPNIGIDEDPVTGAAHCALGPYWRKILQKDALSGFQVSAREGIVDVRFAGNRVFLGGHAITIFEATLNPKAVF